MLPGLAPSIAVNRPDFLLGAGYTDINDLQSYAFTAVAIPHPPSSKVTRRVFVMAVIDKNSADTQITSISFNGSGGTIHVRNSDNGLGATDIAIGSAIVPTGTTLTVGIDAATSVRSRCSIWVGSAVNLRDATPFHTINPAAGTTTNTGNLNITEGAIMMGVASNRTTGGFTWSGLTEFDDVTVESIFASRATSQMGSGSISSPQPITVTGSATGTRLVALSWR